MLTVHAAICCDQEQQPEPPAQRIGALFPDLVLPQSMIETLGHASPEVLSNVLTVAQTRHLGVFQSQSSSFIFSKGSGDVLLH